MEGWVKLYRQTLENPIVCKDAEYFSVWCYLLLNATHKSYKVEFKGEVISLAPGQLITGRKKIAQQFNISESKVQRILKKLEIEQQIEQQTSTKKRLISVLNWDKYQSIEQQDEQQVNNKRTTSEQQVNTNKNVRTEECKEGKKKPLSDVPSDLVKDVITYLNEKTGKAFKPASKKTQSLIKARVNDLSVGLDDFKKVIDVKCSQWLDDERMKKYLQPTTLFGTKFEGYLNEWVEPKKQERSYKLFGDDPADLEGIDIDDVPF